MENEKAHESARKATLVADAIRAGKLVLREQDREWVEELMAAPRGPTGLLNITGLSSRTLATARATSLALSFMSQQSGNPAASDPEQTLDSHKAQNELFRLFRRVFVALVGAAPEYVAEVEIRDRMVERLRTGSDAFARCANEALAELEAFYKDNARGLFNAAKGFGGMKAVAGGQRRFTKSSLDGTRIAGLYVDTQLIPDPVYPYFTGDLGLNALHLQLAHVLFHLLQLQPLVSLELAVPAVFIFPSFEEQLEEHDGVTQAGLADLALRVIAPACSGTMESLDDVTSFVKSHEEAFLKAAMEQRLFVPQGGDAAVHYSWNDAVSLHLENTKGRVEDRLWKAMASLPPGQMVLLNTISRIRPQFHIFENADELQAQPLLSLPVHWHYFELCATATARELVTKKVLPEHSLPTLRALQDDSLGWLSNIPVSGLAELRANQEHAAFREELKKFTAQLASAGPMNVEEVVREVNHGLRTLVDRQQKAIRDIQDKYAPKAWSVAARMGVGAVVGAGLSFMPALAAAIGVGATALPVITTLGAGGLALASEKAGEMVEQRRAKRTMLGMLATAYSSR